MENIYLTAGQMRAARALLRWSAETLAAASGVSVVAIRRTEAKDEPVTMMRANVAAIRSALEAAGIEFIPENGGGPGVRLRKAGAVHATPHVPARLRSVGPEDEDRAGPEAPHDLPRRNSAGDGGAAE